MREPESLLRRRAYARFPSRRAVALLIQTASEWSRVVLQGISQFAAEQGGWDFYIERRGFHEELRIPALWKGHGLIARVTTRGFVQQIHRSRLPCVNVSWRKVARPGIASVLADEAGAARMAVEHFWQRGFLHFGYVHAGKPSDYGETVPTTVAQLVAAAGGRFSRFDDGRMSPATPAYRQRLARWLQRLPSPVAIIVWDAQIGREVATSCANHYRDIPHDVALLCIEDDPLMSSLAPIPLSSVSQNGERVGYQAARLLEELIGGAPVPREPVLIPPTGIDLRLSSDVLAVEDPVVRRAMHLLRAAISASTGMPHLERTLGVSRRTIESRFRKALDRSPAEQLRQFRIDRARQLLRETAMPISRIAALCGFEYPEVFVRAFRRAEGATPSAFRRRHLPGAPHR